MNKLTKCKACSKDIAKGVKKCPSCGKDQRNWFMKHKIITGIIVLSIIGVLGNTADKDSATTDTAKSSTTATTAKVPAEKKEQPVSKVGDVIKTDKFEITITAIQEKTKVGGEFLEISPSEGGIYVTVQWQYKNISEKPIGSFSLPTITLLDKNKTKYNSDIDASIRFSTDIKVDSKVLSDLNPGITVKDGSVFEVSKESYKKGGWNLLIDSDKDINVNVN